VISKIRSDYRDCDYRTNSKKQRHPFQWSKFGRQYSHGNWRLTYQVYIGHQ
jgi:hypothetical protein